MGMRIINQHYIQEENNSRLNSGDAYYHSVHNRLYSCLLSEKKMYRLKFS